MLSTLLSPTVQQSKGPVVKTFDGAVRGRTLRTAKGTIYHAFKGIPYAKPPVGELRFLAPEPPEPWKGVRQATHEGNVCIQPLVKLRVQPTSWKLKDVAAFCHTIPSLLRRAGKMLNQSEDCLYLNVYSPKLTPSWGRNPMQPVLVWIHGGGFLVGDGDSDMFGPDHFIDKGIVVVTINYRLGALGFLSVGTPTAPGNAGLKDQLMAMRWVRRNVRLFGGDSHRITLYGESAGAASVHLHTLNPESRGLFHAAIVGSGSGGHEWALSKRPLEKALELAMLLGIEVTTPEQLVTALRQVSAQSILKATLKMKSDERFIGNELSFLPVVEPNLPGAFLTQHPLESLRQGLQIAVPVMMGANSREGLLWFMGNPGTERTRLNAVEEMTKVNSRVDDQVFLPDEWYNALTADQRVECHKEIMQFYFGDSSICKETLPQFVDLFGDLCFIIPLYRVSRLHACGDLNPVYVYYMSYEGELAFFKRLLRLKIPGVCHGDEMGYLFKNKVLPEPQACMQDNLQRARMLALWCNFIAFGDPTPEEDLGGVYLGVRWAPAWQEGQFSYMEIGNRLKMTTTPPNDRLAFWDGLHRKYLGEALLPPQPPWPAEPQRPASPLSSSEATSQATSQTTSQAPSARSLYEADDEASPGASFLVSPWSLPLASPRRPILARGLASQASVSSTSASSPAEMLERGILAARGAVASDDGLDGLHSPAAGAASASTSSDTSSAGSVVSGAFFRRLGLHFGTPVRLLGLELAYSEDGKEERM